jgi:sugar O-acyltransferase (sialic acid O-acetyltransferase NeuD family)
MIFLKVNYLKTKPIIVLGAGGHAGVCIDALKQSHRSILGVVAPEKPKKNFYDISFLGDDHSVLNYDPADVELVNGIGFLPGNTLRQSLFMRFKKEGYSFAKVIHPSAIIAESCILNEGVQVFAGAVLQPFVTLGENSIINTSASIDHDCVISAHAHIAPGVILSGIVIIGEETFIGAGSVVAHNITIGEKAVVASGQSIYQDVGANQVVIRKIQNQQTGLLA